MPIVTNTIKRPDGTAYTTGHVVIRLVGTNGAPLAGGYVTAGDYTLEGEYRIAALTAGAWTQSLVPNTLISPAGTRWKVTEQVAGGKHVYYLDVRDGAGPYFVEDILDDAPGTVASSALTTHIGAEDVHGFVVAPAPTGGSADLTALQAMVDDLATGGTLRLRAGTYSLGSGANGLLIDNNISIEGAGEEETVLEYTGAGAAIAIQNGLGSFPLRVHLSDFGLDGNDVGAVGLRVGRDDASPFSGGGRFENLTITGFATAGISVKVVVYTQFVHVTSSGNPGDGLLLDPSASYPTTLLFESCQFLTNDRGAVIKKFDSVTFFDCVFEENEREGVVVERANDPALVTRNLTFDRCYLEDNQQSAPNTGVYQATFDSLGGSLLQAIHLIRNRVSQSVSQGTNRCFYLGRGTYFLEGNELNGQNPVIATRDSSSCFVAATSFADPAVQWVLGSASVVDLQVTRLGTRAFYRNVAGTLTKVLEITPTGAFGAFGVTPVTRPTAYTQTYATATKTIANPTASSVATTAATNAAPYGFTTAAQADALVAAVNALIVDMANVKQVQNAVIDDHQALGWLQ